jgi:hypothetical protein
MRSITSGLMLAVFLTATQPARADSGTAPSSEAVRLVEQLSDADYRRREQAVEQLRRLGPPALPALRAAANHPDAEVRRRVNDLIPILEVEAALAPKRVTLKTSDKPLRQVLDALQDQSGYKIDVFGPNLEQKISVDFNDVTFWQALDAVSREAGLVLDPNQGIADGRVRMRSAEAFAPYLHHSGPFRVSVDGLQQLRSVPLSQVPKSTGAPRRSETLTLELTVTTEPRLPLLGVGEPRLLAAYDSERNCMLPPEPLPMGMEQPGPGANVNRTRWNTGRFGTRSTTISTQASLLRPSEKANAIRSIRGFIPVAVLVDQKPVVVVEKIMEAKGKKFQVGKTTIAIESVTEQPNKTIQIQMTVTAEDPEPGWSNTLYQRFELQDAKGKQFNHYGAGWSGNGNSVRLNVNFGPVGTEAPEKFIFQDWTTMQYLLEFEFANIPLP